MRDTRATRSINENRWSIAQCAALLHVDRGTLGEKVKAADIKPVGTERGNRVYDIGDVARAAFERGHGQTPGREAFDPKKLPPKERRDFYASEESRIRLEREQGRLIAIDVHRSAMAGILKFLAAFLDSLPDVLERKCALDPRVVEQLQEQIDGQQEHLAYSLERLEENEASS